jgi:hypothetical protein
VEIHSAVTDVRIDEPRHDIVVVLSLKSELDKTCGLRAERDGGDREDEKLKNGF